VIELYDWDEKYYVGGAETTRDYVYDFGLIVVAMLLGIAVEKWVK
jgi:hypothetical protein